MKISLIAAVAENGVIGADGGLPWSLPDDTKRFMTLTTGHCVVMGRKTFDSMDRRPLPRRTNIVLSRGGAPPDEDAAVHSVTNLATALEIAEKTGDDEAFVIGGEAIYAMALPLADCLYLTRVHAEVAGEVHFPAFDPSLWRLAHSEDHAADARHDHAFSYEDWVRA
jgi:dihydrofolate reductase